MELPFPLVQLLERMENSKSALDRHHNAYHLGELAIKLAAASRAAVYLHRGGGCERANDALAHMIWPSTGDWANLFEHAGNALSAPGHEPLRETREIAEFCGAAHDDVSTSHCNLGRLRPHEFFGLLAQYRNKAIAHAPHKLPSYYERLGPLLESAVRSVIEQMRGTLCLGMSIGNLSGQPRWIAASANYPLEPLIVSGPMPYSVGVLTRITTTERRHGTILRSIEYHDYNTGLRVPSPKPDGEIVTMLVRAGGGLSSAALRERRARKLDEVRDPYWRERRWIGPYEKLGDLGTGGVSRVWLCREREFRRLVALETSRKGEPIGFFPEIDHPNIARTIAQWRHRGRGYVVTEYVDGLDLGRMVRVLRRWYGRAVRDPSSPIELASLAHPTINELDERDGEHPCAMPEEHRRDVARLLAGIARALAQLHAAGIEHRHVDPENIVITRDGQRAVLTNLCAARRGADFTADIAGLRRCLHEFATLSPRTGEHPGDLAGLPGLVRGSAQQIAEALEAYASGKSILLPPSCER